MTDDILKMMEHRKEMKNSNPAEYRRQNKLIKNECIKAKKSWLSEKCREIEKCHRRNDKRMYKDIKELSNKKSKASSSGCIKSKDGKLLFETEDVKNR